MKKVFIDGKSGTTGLRIYERLAQRTDIELLTLSDDERRSPEARKRMLNACDIAFLCLPDDAARESVSMIENENTVVLDTSTAHRTNPEWTYGFPELFEDGFEKVAKAKRIAVPGCHAGGFIALVAPLVKAGIIKSDARLSCHSLTGYSGGGKNMIAEYEADEVDALLGAPRQYGIAQHHKHLPEMMAYTGLAKKPAFCPIVGDFYSGMEVTVPLFADQINGTAEQVKAVLKKAYPAGLVYFEENADENGFLSAAKLSAKDKMEISIHGDEDVILLTARYDNLGKGASGAAIECMNIVLGVAPETGLEL